MDKPRVWRLTIGLFELAILIDLMLYVPFAFLADGFVTFVDVLIDLALLAVLRYMQVQERQLTATPSV